MFVIGEAKGKVMNGRLSLPREYHLRKRKLLGKWKDENTLYISEDDHSLNYAVDKDALYFTVIIDSEDRIAVPEQYENNKVVIRGCISVIELQFNQI